MTWPAVSIIGLVSGKYATVVTPELAAAFDSLLIVASCSKPGSLNLTPKSMIPGMIVLFFASIILSALKSMLSLIFTILFSSINISDFLNTKFSKSIISPFLINIELMILILFALTKIISPFELQYRLILVEE